MSGRRATKKQKKRTLKYCLTLFIGFCIVARQLLAADLSASPPTSLGHTDHEQRSALVIGNSSYKISPLKNPVNDAELIGAALEKAGFKLYDGKVHNDLTYQQMHAVIEGFGSSLTPDGVGLVFYAGHGMQNNGENYLVPINADIKAENEIRYKAVNAGLILAKMEQVKSRINILILDACRNNPFARSFRSSSSGLFSMTAPAGTLVAYSTGPGKVAEDGDGRNSIYSKALAEAIQQEGLTIEETFKKVRSQVRDRTNNRQITWENTSLEGEFVFSEKAGVDTVGDPRLLELRYWESVQTINSAAAYQTYLEKYPQGEYVELAKIVLLHFESERDHAPHVTPQNSPRTKILEDMAIIGRNTANIRAQPATKAQKVDVLSYGTPVTIQEKVSGESVSSTNIWYKIDYYKLEGAYVRKKQGFLSQSLVKPVGEYVEWDRKERKTIPSDSSGWDQKILIREADVDLSIAGEKGHIQQIIDLGYCGSMGCSKIENHLYFSAKKDLFPAHLTCYGGFILGVNFSHGYRDLYCHEYESGISAYRKMRWDGKQYNVDKNNLFSTH